MPLCARGGNSEIKMIPNARILDCERFSQKQRVLWACSTTKRKEQMQSSVFGFDSAQALRLRA